MSEDITGKEFDVTELDESSLDAVTGGSLLGSNTELVGDVDAIACKDNTNCPSCTTNSGNCVAGCT